MGHDTSQAIMAVGFFGSIAIIAMSIAAVYMKRFSRPRESVSIETLGHVSQQLARIESVVETMSLEIERISEAQRFSARLQAESVAGRLPAHAPEVRVITPH